MAVTKFDLNAPLQRKHIKKCVDKCIKELVEIMGEKRILNIQKMTRLAIYSGQRRGNDSF